MPTVVLPSEEGEQDDDARRLKLFAGIGAAVFFVLVLFIWAAWPSFTSKPQPAGTPLASATKKPAQGGQPENNDPLGFVAPAKPLAIVQHTPGSAAPEGTPQPQASASPSRPELPQAWTRVENVTIYAKHGLNARAVKTLKAGTRLLKGEDYQNWTKVKMYGGTEGWVEKKYLVYMEPEWSEKPSPEEGRQALSDFYAEVAKKDYTAAYNRLSDEWKAELTYTDFVKGFKQVRSLDLQLGETEVMSPLTIRQHVIIDADEESRAKRFSGTYELQYHPIEWRLTSGILEEGGPSGSSAPGL
jgi:hypothetical protein